MTLAIHHQNVPLLSDEWGDSSREGADIFLISASISHLNPSSFFSLDTFSLPASYLTFPPSSSPSLLPLLLIHHPACVLVCSAENTQPDDEFGVFPLGLICF